MLAKDYFSIFHKHHVSKHHRGGSQRGKSFFARIGPKRATFRPKNAPISPPTSCVCLPKFQLPIWNTLYFIGVLQKFNILFLIKNDCYTLALCDAYKK